MKTTIPFGSLIVAACGLSGWSCQAPHNQDSGQQQSPMVQASAGPSIVGSSTETQWQYLSAKYDKNGDARIATAEYDRDASSFSSFDKDRNGFIEASDFERSSGGMGGMSMDPASMASMIGPMIMKRYFQGDGDANTLTRVEMLESFAIYDANGDGAINREEFDAESGNRGATPMPGMNRFQMLSIAAVDEDSPEVTSAQLGAYFDSLDTSGSGSIAGSPMSGGRPGPASMEQAQPKVDTAPNAEGQVAPDFSLSMLHAEPGDEQVRLSSFAGDKPVALIFGSYT